MHRNSVAGRCGLWLAALLCGAAWAQAPVYRWVDAGGQVHYGDQPPPTATLVKPAAPPAAAAAATPAVSADDTAKQAEACKHSKDQLGAYSTASTINETDALGNVHQYSAEEKQALVTKTQKYLDEHCAGMTAAAAPAPH